MDYIIPIYNAPAFALQRHIDVLKKIPEVRNTDIRMVLIDDCSTPELNPKWPIGPNIKAARVEDDILWHAEGAMNLGFMLADDGWCILGCIDHIIPAEDLVKCIYLKKDKKSIYIFNRFLPNGQLRNKNVSGVCLIHRDTWWHIGGFDEEFCGEHGCTDWLSLGCINPNDRASGNPSIASILGYKFVQTDIKIIEYKDAGANLHLNRYSERNWQMYLRKLEELKQGKYHNKSKLNFKWHITYESQFNISSSSVPSPA